MHRTLAYQGLDCPGSTEQSKNFNITVKLLIIGALVYLVASWKSKSTRFPWLADVIAPLADDNALHTDNKSPVVPDDALLY